MKGYHGSQSADDRVAQTPERTKVGIAEFETTASAGLLTTTGFGSCIGVAVFDEPGGVGELLQVMLLTAGDVGWQPSEVRGYGGGGTGRAPQGPGATRRNLEAETAGGSDMLDFSESGPSIIERNAVEVRAALEDFGLPRVAEVVGGDHAGSLQKDATTDDLTQKCEYGRADPEMACPVTVYCILHPHRAMACQTGGLAPSADIVGFPNHFDTCPN